MLSLNGLVYQPYVSVLLPDIVIDSLDVLFSDVGVNLNNLCGINNFDLTWAVDLVIYLKLWAVICITRPVRGDYTLVLHLKIIYLSSIYHR